MNNKLLIEIEKRNSTTDNFMFGFGRCLNRIGYDYRFRTLAEISEDELRWCDAYIAVRPNTPISFSIGKAIKKSGRPYIVYFDDDLINRVNSIRKRNENSRKCLAISDAMFGANPMLCREYGRFSKSFFIMDTAVDESELSFMERDSSKTHFVYAAGKDHAAIFERIINPVLGRLYDNYHDHFRFTFIGVHPQIDNKRESSCFEFVPLMPLEEYVEYMRKHVFDVGLAPLEDNDFSRMKYFNKYIEYGKVGMAGIYSNMEPYTFVVKNGENGLLVNNTEEEWYRAISYCIDNIDTVRKLGINAQNDIKKRFVLDKITSELKEKLDEIIGDAQHDEIFWKRSRTQEKEFYFEDKLKKSINIIRDRGVKEMIKCIKQKR